jgi:hypothetical protein
MPSATEEMPSAAIVDPRIIDPRSGEPWPEFMDTPLVIRYMQARGIRRSAQTLSHQRAAGAGIRWKYLGQKPMATKAEIDRHIEHDLFADASPLIRKRGRKPAAEAAAATWTPADIGPATTLSRPVAKRAARGPRDV